MNGLLSLYLALLAAPDLILQEAARLELEAERRQREPGGVIALIELERLGPWLPEGEIEHRLRRLARSSKRAPLLRAQAWWLLHRLALNTLKPQLLKEAREALGLINEFQLRLGPAPRATEALKATEGWRRYPSELGGGEGRWAARRRAAPQRHVTLATRLRGVDGPAVLRLGYDDRLKIWLNGEEIYLSPAAHRSSLDQAAVPVALTGDDRLLLELEQEEEGAWRLLLRVTDPEGAPLPSLEASADPWGVPPEPRRDEPEEFVHLWRDLQAATSAEEPGAQEFRDLALYARYSGMPDREQLFPQAAVESAWALDPSPRSLWSWLRIISTDERSAVRSAHPLWGPLQRDDLHAAREIALEAAWEHYYARRHRESLKVVERLLEEAPSFLPAQRLKAVIYEDLKLPHSAVALLESAIKSWPKRAGLRRAQIAALRSGGRQQEAIKLLETWIDEGGGGLDERYQLVELWAAQGREDEAVELLDELLHLRPDLWSFALEAAVLKLQSGADAEALERLTLLNQRLPGEQQVLLKLAELLHKQGRREEALALLQAAPSDPELEALNQRWTGGQQRPHLGPSLEVLRSLESPSRSPAHLLYQHLWLKLDEQGRATRRLRRVLRILDEEGAEELRSWEIPYVPGQQRLIVEQAQLIRKGSAPISPARSDRDLSEPAYRLYYDLRAEVLSFPKLKAGDLLEVVWSLQDSAPDPSFPGYFGTLIYLQEELPQASSVLELSGARAQGLKRGLVLRGLKPPRSDQTLLRFEATPAIHQEPRMGGASSTRPYLHLSTLHTWQELDRRYQQLLGARLEPSEALKTLAESWIAGAQEPELQIARLYTEVAHRTRYVGLEFGQHSFQPAWPKLTLARGYGDCKDKAALLIALSRSIGIPAKLVLLRTRAAGGVAPMPPSFALFDHALVYMPSLGRFLDPTVDRNDPWVLPSSDQGALAFIIAEGDGLQRIPPQPPEANLIEWRLEGRRLRISMRGLPATRMRHQLEGEGDPRLLLERLLGRYFPGASPSAPQIKGLTPALDPVEIELELKEVSGVPLAPKRLARYAQAAEREHPLELEHQALERFISLDPKIKAQPERSLESPFGRFSLKLEPGRMELSFQLNRLRIEPQEYPDFRAWLAEVDALRGSLK